MRSKWGQNCPSLILNNELDPHRWTGFGHDRARREDRNFPVAIGPFPFFLVFRCNWWVLFWALFCPCFWGFFWGLLGRIRRAGAGKHCIAPTGCFFGIRAAIRPHWGPWAFLLRGAWLGWITHPEVWSAMPFTPSPMVPCLRTSPTALRQSPSGTCGWRGSLIAFPFVGSPISPFPSSGAGVGYKFPSVFDAQKPSLMLGAKGRNHDGPRFRALAGTQPLWPADKNPRYGKNVPQSRRTARFVFGFRTFFRFKNPGPSYNPPRALAVPDFLCPAPPRRVFRPFARRGPAVFPRPVQGRRGRKRGTLN